MAHENSEASVKNKSTPAYCPYPTVKNFIVKQKETGLPHRIDKSVMSNLSGAAQSHLLAALKFLRLIDESGTPSDSLKRLVESSDTPQWKIELGKVIDLAYEPYISHLSLVTATPAQISEAFRKDGLTEGSVTEKAIRFYLKALDDADVKYSAHFKKTRGPRTGTKKKRLSPEVDDTIGHTPKQEKRKEGNQQSEIPPQGMIEFPIYFPGKPAGKIIVANDIDEVEVALVEAQIAVLKLYAQRNSRYKPKG